MILRCHNRKHRSFEFYGALGIRVCDEWRGPGGFERFYAHVGDRPPGHTLDRIDRERGYEPGNVRWSRGTVQNRNHGNVLDAKKYVGPDGVARTIAEWSDLLDIRPDTLRQRVRKGLGPAAFVPGTRGSLGKRPWKRRRRKRASTMSVPWAA